MDTKLLEEKFERMGARVRITPAPRVARVRVDVKHDRKGEYFDLAVNPDEPLRVEVLDVRPRDRHLLLMVAPDTHRGRVAPRDKQKFLCGHDERAWFVAAVPEDGSASNVRTAMDALKPREVHLAEARHRVRFDRRFSRKNAAFVRQGEWFFVPAPSLHVPSKMITRNEPIRRNLFGSKPHIAEFAYRAGGQLVYVSHDGAAMLWPAQYERLAKHQPREAAKYRPQRHNPQLWVKGRVSHADHATITLRDWHEVIMNTENQSSAMKFVAFID